ncbi:hypothetical protein BraRD5C2_67810 [Bradyrhizobium sp. RD5-C2]|nr:hypothetical protein BraRD5C2_67810 [Bradyrhizobium sp. RD5-C2]
MAVPTTYAALAPVLGAQWAMDVGMKRISADWFTIAGCLVIALASLAIVAMFVF